MNRRFCLFTVLLSFSGLLLGQSAFLWYTQPSGWMNSLIERPFFEGLMLILVLINSKPIK